MQGSYLSKIREAREGDEVVWLPDWEFKQKVPAQIQAGSVFLPCSAEFAVCQSATGTSIITCRLSMRWSTLPVSVPVDLPVPDTSALWSDCLTEHQLCSYYCGVSAYAYVFRKKSMSIPMPHSVVSNVDATGTRMIGKPAMCGKMRGGAAVGPSEQR